MNWTGRFDVVQGMPASFPFTTPRASDSEPEAQELLAPAVAGLTDEIFGAGTYDKIQAL